MKAKARKTYSEEITIRKRGRPRKFDVPPTSTERVRKHRQPKIDQKKRCVGVIDCETDEFDNVTQEFIKPFLFVIYTDERPPIVIWDENFKSLIKRLLAALDTFEEPFTWYAHNGGKFDFMFLVHELRGPVSFKGRGIMEAKLGRHTLRDSFHIIPEKLANIQKEKFDYANMNKLRRGKFRQQIIDYCISDCRYLLDIVKKFVADFGLKLSIGQAAMYELRKFYNVEKFSDAWDAHMRQFFFGGRVECLKGRGHFKGDYKLFDVNSMYPFVMAHRLHPVGSMGDYTQRLGVPSNNTVFVDLTCENNGALIARDESGATTANIRRGRFYTTIHEYQTALAHGLIGDIKINYCYDCSQLSNFSKFVLPLYSKRQLTKKILNEMRKAGQEGTSEFLNVKSRDLFYKLLLNNAYGKFAQNPRAFREHYLTDPDEEPPPEWFASLELRADGERWRHPAFESKAYWIWTKPAPSFRFNNVGTAASITGAARAVLLDAKVRAIDPIYCDTDSLICRDLPGVRLDKEELGAWDIEDEFKSVIVNGKKLYSCEFAKPKPLPDGQIDLYKIRSKGTAGLTWAHMEMLLDGKETAMPSFGPTLNKFGDQKYITRTIRATAHLTGVQYAN